MTMKPSTKTIYEQVWIPRNSVLDDVFMKI